MGNHLSNPVPPKTLGRTGLGWAGLDWAGLDWAGNIRFFKRSIHGLLLLSLSLTMQQRFSGGRSHQLFHSKGVLHPLQIQFLFRLELLMDLAWKVLEKCIPEYTVELSPTLFYSDQLDSMVEQASCILWTYSNQALPGKYKQDLKYFSRVQNTMS